MSKLAPGLDIDLGNACSKTAFGWARQTFANRAGMHGETGDKASFANVMRFGELSLAMCTDGIGTKAELAERTGLYGSLGFDLLCMVADDLACMGAEPTNVVNVLDVDRLDHEVVDQLLAGLAEAAASCGVSVVGGEIAELGSRIGGWGEGMHFNWAATAIGVVHGEPIDSSAVRPGDAVVAIASAGLRSNGFSLVRRVLGAALGDDWHQAPFDEERTWGEVVLTPSLITSPLVVTLLAQGLRPHGIAHVTGGGTAENLARSLNGCGTVLDSLFQPHPVMLRLQELGGIEEAEAYRLWNMGQALLLVMDPGQAEGVLETAEELGYSARLAGRVTESPEVIVHTRGLHPQVLVHG